MLGFMKNTKIGTRIIMAMILPVMGLLVFSGMVVVDKNRVSSDLADLQELATLAPSISALVHEMQKERGASAGYIGSKGRKFIQKLPAQRLHTDRKHAMLKAALAKFNAAAFGTRLVSSVSVAEKALSQLDMHRTQVTDLSTTVPQMAKYYTSTIANWLSIVEEMAVVSSNARLTGAITAYTSYLQAKERAGIERAMGAGGFGSGAFQPPVYRRFLQLIAMQDTFLSVFRNYATQDQIAVHSSTVSGSAVNEVNRMRKIAIEFPVSNDLKGITGPQWFDTITQKIELLKKVEDRVATDLHSLARGIHGEALTGLYVSGGMAIVLLLVTMVLVTLIVRGITRPLASMTDAMGRLADKDMSVEIHGIGRGDEIGAMATAVQIFKDNMIKADELASEQEKEHEAKQERAQRIEQMTRDFDEQVGGVVETVSSAATEMRATAESMSSTAEGTSHQSSAVAAAAEQASANVQTVAAAAEELAKSVEEISRQVAKSNEIVVKAVDEVESTNARVQGLDEAAQKIGDVVGMISDVAEQTNLLALNATIEAARAGDAGKGFAVVATEVKELANQTAKATGEISSQITGIQSATRDSVEAIESIGGTIGEISEIVSVVAAAVEEQGAATREIARNTEQAASGTLEVTSNITGVTQAASETGVASGEVLQSAGQLSKQSDKLRKEVESFVAKVRAA